MQNQWNSQAFNDLRKEWYDKLAAEGFSDLERREDIDGNLLGHNPYLLMSLDGQARIYKRVAYQERIDSFANDPQFPEVLKIMVKSRTNRSIFDEVQIEMIWTFHRNGISSRGIAREMGCSQSCIHFLLKRMREWMSLIA